MNQAREYVEGALALFKDSGVPVLYEFAGKYGREFDLKITRDSGKEDLGKCYRNAHTLCIRKGYQYVEGWAVSPGLPPLEHAWCYDTVDGRIIDPTWKDGGEYFGVVMDLRAVSELAVEYGYYGVSGNIFRMRSKLGEVRSILESLVWRPPTKIGEQMSLGERTA